MSKYHARKSSRQSCNQQRNSRPYRAVEARQDACHDADRAQGCDFQKECFCRFRSTLQKPPRNECADRFAANAKAFAPTTPSSACFRMLGVDVSSLRTNQTVTACAKKCDENARALFAFFVRPMQARLHTVIYFFYFRRQRMLIFYLLCRRLLRLLTSTTQLLIFTCQLQTADCIKDRDRAFHALAIHEYMPR